MASGAFWALAVIGVLAGGVLFLLLAGALAGFSLAGPARDKYALVDAPEDTLAVQPDVDEPPLPAPSPSAADDEGDWPDNLP